MSKKFNPYKFDSDEQQAMMREVEEMINGEKSTADAGADRMLGKGPSSLFGKKIEEIIMKKWESKNRKGDEPKPELTSSTPDSSNTEFDKIKVELQHGILYIGSQSIYIESILDVMQQYKNIREAYNTCIISETGRKDEFLKLVIYLVYMMNKPSYILKEEEIGEVFGEDIQSIGPAIILSEFGVHTENGEEQLLITVHEADDLTSWMHIVPDEVYGLAPKLLGEEESNDNSKIMEFAYYLAIAEIFFGSMLYNSAELLQLLTNRKSLNVFRDYIRNHKNTILYGDGFHVFDIYEPLTIYPIEEVVVSVTSVIGKAKREPHPVNRDGEETEEEHEKSSLPIYREEEKVPLDVLQKSEVGLNVPDSDYEETDRALGLSLNEESHDAVNATLREQFNKFSTREAGTDSADVNKSGSSETNSGMVVPVIRKV